jgi:hypothetical protein
MKITVNQLRKIIKEEVGRMMEGEGYVPPGKVMFQLKE